jgi:hypothetical protein
LIDCLIVSLTLLTKGMDYALSLNCAFVMCPCCVGKLKFAKSKFDNNAFNSDLKDTTTRPRSQWLRDAGVQSTPFLRVLARLGDHSEPRDVHDEAKLLIELDRCAYVKERGNGYQLYLTKIEPRNASPRNDIIIALPFTMEWFDSKSTVP